MAERVGFEPTKSFDSALFKSAAINHSATSPRERIAKDLGGSEMGGWSQAPPVGCASGRVASGPGAAGRVASDRTAAGPLELLECPDPAVWRPI